MLLRYPGLTVVGGLAIAFGVSVGAGTFEWVGQVLRPTLPLDGGDRIVGIRIRDRQTAGFERQLSYDFKTWRDELSTVTDLGAFRMVRRNLITGEGGGEPIEVAEISASAFRLARVPPLMGRTLDASDEQPGAQPVVVLGYDVWQTRLGGDPTVIGQTVRLGSVEATVVGVMPEGFEFPISQRLWIPFRLSASGYAPREGPVIQVFGRLAPGATLEQAQVELTALSLRTAADLPDTHRHLAAEVMPFARSIVTVSATESRFLRLINVLVVMLLILACGNVALLMFARAASRESEIVVRNALGASRRRIITQLVAEALVLAVVGAFVGIGATRLLLKSWLTALELMGGMGDGGLPFWFRDTLAPTTVVYAAGLTVLAAVIAGVIPGLKATRGLQARLRQATHGGGGLQFGGVWTILIVTQIAVTVAVPAFAVFIHADAFGRESTDVRIPEHEYLAAELVMDRDDDEDPAAFLARLGAAIRELEQRLGIEPAVVGLTRADLLPHMSSARLIEVDEGGAPLGAGNCIHECAGYRVSSATVDRNFFQVLSNPIRAGRGFAPGDFRGVAGTVIVNQSFVDRVMGGRDPVGRRLRYIDLDRQDGPAGEAEPGPWIEIVGVVGDMEPPHGDPARTSRVYHPMPPSGVYPARIAVHVRGDVQAFARRLRMIGADVDPSLRLEEVLPLDKLRDADLRFARFWFWLIVVFSAVAMVLSMAGIYSVMAFTVSRRTREIGIRVALGSSRAGIAFAIFRRPLIHVALGVALGAGFTSLSSSAISLDGDPHKPRLLLMVIMYGLLMMGVCLLACIVPTRRALRVEPTEALKADG